MYIQASFNDTAVFTGAGVLDEQELGGRNFSFGAALGSGIGGDGGYLFMEIKTIIETVSFLVHGRPASGVLDGGEFTIGLGGSKSLGKYLAFSVSTSYTHSGLGFTRTRAGNDSTVDFPTAVSVEEDVKRVDWGAYSASLTLSPTRNIHLFTKAVARSEESVTSGIRISF